MKITGNSAHLSSLYIAEVASSWRHCLRWFHVLAILRTTFVTELNSSRTVFSQNCDSTVSNLCSLWCSISWYASCWNFIKLCCLQWKLYTEKLRGSANYGPPCRSLGLLRLYSITLHYHQPLLFTTSLASGYATYSLQNCYTYLSCPSVRIALIPLITY